MPRCLLALILSICGLSSLAQAQVDFSQRLADHAYLSHVNLEPVPDADPFDFYIQLPGKADPELLKETIEAYLPWLKEIARIVEEDYLTPVDLELAPEPVGVVLLASRGDYENYMRGGGVRWNYGPGGGWDPALRAVVGYQDVYGTPRPSYRQRGPVLRDAVLGLLAPLTMNGLKAPGSEWLIGGLAQSLGYHFGRKPNCLPDATPDRKALGVLRGYLDTDRARKAYWLDLKFLLQPKDATGLGDLAGFWLREKFGKKERLSPAFAASLPIAMRLQSWEWIKFLQRGKEARYQKSMPALLALALAGELDPAALVALLDLEDGQILVDQFHAHLDGVFKKVLRRSPMQRLVSASKGKAEFKSGASGAAVEAPVETPRSFDPAVIHVPMDTPEMLLGSALDAARGNRFAEALSQLEQALSLQPEHAQTLRTRARIQALQTVREAWLEDLVASKGKLRLRIGEKLRAFEVTGIEAGKLVFRRARDGVKDLDLADFSTEDLLTNLTKKWSDYGPEWSRVFAQFLSEDEDWVRQARGVGSEGESLLADQQAHERLLRLGECLRLGRWLGNQALPQEADQIHFVYERLKSMRQLAEGLPEFESNLDDMRAYGRALLEARNQFQEKTELFTGELESLGEDRYRFTYDFSEIRQLRDFQTAGDALQAVMATSSLRLSEDQWGTGVRGGMLCLRGRGALTHRLRFRGEVVHTYRYGHYQVPGFELTQVWFLLGAHWNEVEHSLFGSLTSWRFWADTGQNQYSEGSPEYELFQGEGMDPGTVSLTYDGVSEVRMTRGGLPPIRIEMDGGLNSGRAFVGFNTELEVRIDDWVIDGYVDSSEWSAQWAERNAGELDSDGF